MRLGKKKRCNRNCFQKMERKDSQIIYHYTDLNALISILGKNYITLRATNCLYLNDSNEIIEGIESIKRVDNTNISDSAFRSYYLTSFSQQSDCLSMWGMYAANGSGCAIGFDLNIISRSYNGFIRCTYGKEQIDDNLRNLLNLIRNGVCTFFPTNGEPATTKKNEGKALEDMITNQYIATCLGSKNENYNFEDEIRCFIGNHDKKKEIHFKVKNGIIIPFLNIEIPKEALKCIVIGPTNKSQLTMQSIMHMLSINEYDWRHISLITSKVPYRG